MPKPPSLAARANRSLSVSFGGYILWFSVTCSGLQCNLQQKIAKHAAKPPDMNFHSKT